LANNPHPNPSPQGEGLSKEDAEAGMAAMSETFKEKGGELYLAVE
jgi:hypothetical protein